MRWGITLNKQHVELWCGFAVLWGIFVGLALVLGWHLGPRPDEVLICATLPLWVLVPYVAFCLVSVLLKAWLWPVGRAAWQRLRLVHAVVRQRIGQPAR